MCFKGQAFCGRCDAEAFSVPQTNGRQFCSNPSLVILNFLITYMFDRKLKELPKTCYDVFMKSLRFFCLSNLNFKNSKVTLKRVIGLGWLF